MELWNGKPKAINRFMESDSVICDCKDHGSFQLLTMGKLIGLHKILMGNGMKSHSLFSFISAERAFLGYIPSTLEPLSWLIVVMDFVEDQKVLTGRWFLLMIFQITSYTFLLDLLTKLKDIQQRVFFLSTLYSPFP